MRKATRLILLALTLICALSIMACSKKATEKKPVSSGTEDVNTPPVEGASKDTSAPLTDPKADEDLATMLSKAKTSDNYYYEFIVKDEKEVTMSIKTWAMRKKVRMDVTAEGEESSMFLDDEKGEYYMYTKANNTAIKINIPANNSTYNPFTYVGTLDKSSFKAYKKGNSENLDGNKCIVYSYEYQGSKVVIYVEEQYGVILKCDNYTDGKLVNSIYFKDFKAGGVTEEMVTIPKGVEILKLN